MSNFWAQRLGIQPAQPPAPQPAVGQQPWWAPPAPPVPVQQAPAQPGYPQPMPQQPQPEQQGWGDEAKSRAKAKSARLTDICPECSSGNVFRPEGQPNAMLQCYECGYNPRFHQSGGGGGLPSETGSPATPARQIGGGGGAGGVSNFNPGTIVGRA